MRNAIHINFCVICHTNAQLYFQSKIDTLLAEIRNISNIQHSVSCYWKEPRCSAIELSFDTTYPCCDLIVSHLTALCKNASKSLAVESSGEFVEIACYTPLSEILSNSEAAFMVCYIRYN